VSPENVEIAQQAWAAWGRGDRAAALAAFDDDVVATRIAPMPDVRLYRGPQGLLQMLADWVEQFGEFQMSAVEFTDCNDSQLVVRVHQSATGVHSGAPIEADFWFVHTMRDGKIVRWDIYGNEAQALKAVGLAG
jgi:ketosteroid isomerase-like protein